MEECTFYIEEVFSDNNHDDADDVQIQNEKLKGSFKAACRVDDTTSCETKVSIKEVKNNVETKLSLETMQPCPIPIGGGSTVTLIKQKLYIIGGYNRSGSSPSSDVHYYDFETQRWTCNVECKGDLPLGRFAHTAVAMNSKIYVFGGQALIDDNFFNETKDTTKQANPTTKRKLTSLNCVYCLDTESSQWTRIKGTKSLFSLSKYPIPEPRNSHSCVLSKEKECMIIFGGANDDSGPMNDVWSFDLKNGCHGWTQLHCCNVTPAAREMHSACIDETSNAMYIMGGRNVNGNVCQDVWTLDLDLKIWNKETNMPSPRCAHIANVISPSRGDSQKQGCIVLHGGWNGTNHIYDDFLVYDFSEKRWQTEALPAVENVDIVPRFGHASCSAALAGDMNALIIFGGVNSTSDLRDVMIVKVVTGV